MIYLKQIKSGNYKISDHWDYTILLETKEEIRDLFKNLKGNKIIKATYRLNQTYYRSPQEFINKNFKK